jgi:hypothetical protein
VLATAKTSFVLGTPKYYAATTTAGAATAATRYPTAPRPRLPMRSEHVAMSTRSTGAARPVDNSAALATAIRTENGL